MFQSVNISQSLLETLVSYGIIIIVVGYILVTYGKILILGSAALFSIFVLAKSDDAVKTTNVPQVEINVPAPKKLSPDELFLKDCEEVTNNKLQCIELLEDKKI